MDIGCILGLPIDEQNMNNVLMEDIFERQY